MKKFTIIISVFLFLTFTVNTVTAVAQPKSYSQGFYTMKDLNLYENRNYTVQNNSPFVDGWLIIFDSNKNIQQINRIAANSSQYPLSTLRSDYTLIVYGDVNLVFS